MALVDVLALRDAINNLIDVALRKRNLSPRYAVVKGTIDHNSNKVMVLFNGTDDAAENYIPVVMNTIHPTAAGDVVRICGSGSDQYVDDVITPGHALLKATLI